MKINEDLIYRIITDEHILIPVGKTALEHNGVFVMTEVGGRIWELLRDGKERKEIVSALLDEYDVEESLLRQLFRRHQLLPAFEHVFRRLFPSKTGGGLTVLAAVDPHRRIHIGSRLDLQPVINGKAVDGLNIAGVVGRDGAVDLNRKAQLLQLQNISGHRVIGRNTTQIAVGFVVSAIQRDIDPGGRIVAEQLQNFLGQQEGICIDGNHQAHFPQGAVDVRKIRPQHRFAAGQQQKQHTPVSGLPAQFDPLLGCQFPAGILILVDIAHFAPEITPGRQFKIACQRYAPSSGAGMQDRGNQGFLTQSPSFFFHR